MRIILLGAPGAGKGTQAERICRDYSAARISTGDMLRAEIAAGTKIGQSLQKAIESGQFVSDEMIITLVKNRLETLEAEKQTHYLFDGFPRTLQQAKALESLGIIIDHVIYIDVSDADIIERLSGRRIHLSSGRTYHTSLHPDQRDDLTGEPLVQRADDREEVVRERLSIYHRETKPLINWYQNKARKFSRIKGDASIDAVWIQIQRAMEATEEVTETSSDANKYINK